MYRERAGRRGNSTVEHDQHRQRPPMKDEDQTYLSAPKQKKGNRHTIIALGGRISEKYLSAMHPAMLEIPQPDILAPTMSDQASKLPNPPIVEAILDIDCDMPPGWQLESVEASAREVFRERYPKFRTQYFQHHTIEGKADAPLAATVRHGIAAFQFLHDDEKQLVQCRVQGFSFNRLAPYTTLDDYLAEIRESWTTFCALVSPVMIKQIRLRFINRIPIPLKNGTFDLDQYLSIGPRLPDKNSVTEMRFLNQIAAQDKQSGHTMNIVLTTQPIVLTTQPDDGKQVPIIFDNCVIASSQSHEPDDWDWILKIISELRALKNRVFFESVTSKCKALFQ